MNKYARIHLVPPRQVGQPAPQVALQLNFNLFRFPRGQRKVPHGSTSNWKIFFVAVVVKEKLIIRFVSALSEWSPESPHASRLWLWLAVKWQQIEARTHRNTNTNACTANNHQCGYWWSWVKRWEREWERDERALNNLSWNYEDSFEHHHIFDITTLFNICNVLLMLRALK